MKKPDPAIDALARRAVAAGGKSLGLGADPSNFPNTRKDTPRRNKYGAVRTEYRGERYDSKAEADYAARLDEQRAFVPEMWYVRQVTFRLGCPENAYRVDFLVVWPRILDPVHAVDVKGVYTAKFRHDLALWRSYGPCPLVVVKRTRGGWTEEVIHGRRQP